ncbi:hypothetical protein ACVWXM_009634 [Bradyrhizobium sp. GM7.3]
MGPVIGGIVVAAAGAVAVFALNPPLYLPLIAALLMWENGSPSPWIKTVLIRTLLSGISGGAIIALMPLGRTS